jgi:hypothetical protein
MSRARSVIATLVLVTAAASGCTSGAPEEPAANRQSTSPSTGTGEAPPVGGTETVADDPAGLSALEQRVASALASVGVATPGVAEHGFRSASVWGGWHGGKALVNAFEQAGVGTPGNVTGTVDLEGIPGEVVATEAFGNLVRFDCDTLAVEVVHLQGDGVAGSGNAAEAETLARLLVPALDC